MCVCFSNVFKKVHQKIAKRYNLMLDST